MKVQKMKNIIDSIENHKRTVQALGLKQIRDKKVHADTHQIRGMIHKVRHLVRVEEVDE